MTGTMWFWRHDDQQGGPVTWDGLMALARAGKLRSSDPVLRQGTDQWVRADQARVEGPPGLPAAAPAPMGQPPFVPPGAVPQAPPAYQPPQYHASAMPPGALPPPGFAGAPTLAMGHPGFMRMPAEGDFDGNGYAQGSGESHQGSAIASFVVSLVGLLIFGWLCGMIAIGTGLKALNGMKVSGNPSGRGLAIAGIVIGVLDLVGVLLFVAMRAMNVAGTH